MLDRPQQNAGQTPFKSDTPLSATIVNMSEENYTDADPARGAYNTPQNTSRLGREPHASCNRQLTFVTLPKQSSGTATGWDKLMSPVQSEKNATWHCCAILV